MAVLLPEGKQSYTNGTGAPLVGGKLYTYDAGTTTPRATYSDSAGVTPNANPTILDARGEATVFWNGSYKVVLKDSADVTIWTQDNVSSTGGSGSGSFTTLTVTGAATFSDATSPIIVAKIGPSSTQQHTLPVVASDTVALLAAAQTMTNKTLTTPVIAAISNGGTVTIPTGADTFAVLAGTQTFSNKTINGLKTASTVNDSTDAAGFTIGYRQIPQNAQNGNYTLVLADNGKHIYSVNAGAQTITIPTNASVAFPTGTACVIFNNGTTAITISTTSLTVYQAGTANTGNRTLAVKGLASLLKIATDTWVISGSGIT